eukprot:Nitzschia sp. Nitz4//scaffold128_size63911//50443//51243//NITZ4_006229-RA/size63911-processed-gene-0.138-mRNA-1//-1//CDS//3329534862//6664//frame0
MAIFPAPLLTLLLWLTAGLSVSASPISRVSPAFLTRNQRAAFFPRGGDGATKDPSSHPPRIIIIGGPASGKGTQCQGISEKYGVVHLSTGDMLRQAVQDQTPVGMQARQYMDRGELVPDEIILELVQNRISQPDCVERGWLLDGFPRTQAQAALLSALGIDADLTLLLNVPDEDLIQRVIGRRLDPETGNIYHMVFRPPPADILARLEQRSDDTREKMTKRLEQYHSHLEQVRSTLEASMVEIDGTGSPDDVGIRIEQAIDAHLQQ